MAAETLGGVYEGCMSVFESDYVFMTYTLCMYIFVDTYIYTYIYIYMYVCMYVWMDGVELGSVCATLGRLTAALHDRTG